MPIMQPRQDIVTKPGTYTPGSDRVSKPDRNRQPSLLPGDKTTQPSTIPATMQPSMQPNKPLGNQPPIMRESVQSGPSPAALTTTPAPAAVPGQPPTTTTSERTHAIIGRDSPLMRQAATRGRQYAHQRGLLNSSLAAGAAQGAVLDRSIDLARSDVDAEFKSFYAGLDKAKFESDISYRNKALDQERQLHERRITLDERVAESAIGIEEERLTFDRERFNADEGYRDRVLAQENELATTRLDFDRDRFRSDEDYRRDVLAQEHELATERLTFDKARFESDADYRDRVLGQENDLSDKRLNFDRDRFRSDAAYREDVLDQELGIETRRLDLAAERTSFDASSTAIDSSLTIRTGARCWRKRSICRPPSRPRH